MKPKRKIVIVDGKEMYEVYDPFIGKRYVPVKINRELDRKEAIKKLTKKIVVIDGKEMYEIDEPFIGKIHVPVTSKDVMEDFIKNRMEKKIALGHFPDLPLDEVD